MLVNFRGNRKNVLARGGGGGKGGPAMDWHSIRGGVYMLLVAKYYKSNNNYEPLDIRIRNKARNLIIREKNKKPNR